MGAYSNVSPFVEAQAIIAAQEGDIAELDRLVAGMLPGERVELAVASFRLLDALGVPR
jgi:hypothetical protein